MEKLTYDYIDGTLEGGRQGAVKIDKELLQARVFKE